MPYFIRVKVFVFSGRLRSILCLSVVGIRKDELGKLLILKQNGKRSWILTVVPEGER